MLTTPSQQCQESWHNTILHTTLPGMFKGSTESVFSKALPKLIQMDGIKLPDKLGFHVPAVPKEVVTKATFYVKKQDSYIQIEKSVEGEFVYYFLRQDNPLGLKKISKQLVGWYQATLEGDLPYPTCKEQKLFDICFSMHCVYAADEWGVPDCTLNPAQLNCPSCKGFKLYGICSHVLAVNHILGKIELFRLSQELCAPRRKGGFMKGVRPALRLEDPKKKAALPAPDSSDEALDSSDEGESPEESPPPSDYGSDSEDLPLTKRKKLQ